MQQVQAAAKRPEVSDKRAARKESARAATGTEVTNKLNKLHIFVDRRGRHPQQAQRALGLLFVYQADVVSTAICGWQQQAVHVLIPRCDN